MGVKPVGPYCLMEQLNCIKELLSYVLGSFSGNNSRSDSEIAASKVIVKLKKKGIIQRRC